MINISELIPEIERVCRALPMKRLGIFGSAVTEGFAHDSDIDVPVVFDLDENIDFFDKSFELKEQLSKTFNLHVDLVGDKPFKNPFFIIHPYYKESLFYGLQTIKGYKMG